VEEQGRSDQLCPPTTNRCGPRTADFSQYQRLSSRIIGTAGEHRHIHVEPLHRHRHRHRCRQCGAQHPEEFNPNDEATLQNSGNVRRSPRAPKASTMNTMNTAAFNVGGSESHSTESDCSFCSIQAARRPPEDRILASTEDFYLLAALGPLTNPHLLAIPRMHIESLRRESKPHLVESYEAFKALALTGGPQGLDPLVEIEHGPGRTLGGGPCINHSHVHWLFTETPILELLCRQLPSPSSADGPYIWIRQAGGPRRSTRTLSGDNA
jgi:hypothetical protein